MTFSSISTDQNKNFKRRLKGKFYPFLLLTVILVSQLVGCQIERTVDSIVASPTPTTMNLTAETQTRVASDTLPAVTATESNTLVIWLPPQFDPQSASPLGVLIQNRLAAFQKDHPEWTIEVRLKTVAGKGGLLDSLNNTSLAAPGALPTLIALPYSDLQTAALNGLLVPLDNQMPGMTNNDFFAYAADLGTVQGKYYGIPLAGDALAMVYHPLQSPYPPSTWQELSIQHLPVIFPAADPNALVVTTIYQDAGGNLMSQNDSPVIENDPLQRTFEILNNGTQSGAFPDWIAQFSTFDMAWKAYNQQTTGYAIIWASQYLTNPPADSELTNLPAINSQQKTLATGWVWCIPLNAPQSEETAILLAKYFSDADFVNQLDQLAGYLPVYTSGLDSISNPKLKQAITNITASALILPSSSTINIINPVLANSTTQIIKKQIYYEQAVGQVLNSLKQ
jgi:multiple sugar transport system substrate-binding protein